MNLQCFVNNLRTSPSRTVCIIVYSDMALAGNIGDYHELRTYAWELKMWKEWPINLPHIENYGSSTLSSNLILI